MSENKITRVFANPKSGSIRIDGTIEVVDAQGNIIAVRTDEKLCGCGLSQDKPFCDKSHANYVNIVATLLQDARNRKVALTPLGVTAVRASEIRKRSLENRVAAGESLIGVKFGGALLKDSSENKNYEGIFGYLTDAMLVNSTLRLADFISPIAEAEVVFKLNQELSRVIELSEVQNYVSHVAAGIEIFDCRYGPIDPFINDAIADNACSGAIAIGEWVDASNVNLLESNITIYEAEQLKESVSATSIAGNPWQAVANVSKKLNEVGVILPAGSIIFSGSATNGIAMQPGKYRVEISGLGEVSFEAN